MRGHQLSPALPAGLTSGGEHELPGPRRGCKASWVGRGRGLDVVRYRELPEARWQDTVLASWFQAELEEVTRAAGR